MRVLLAASQGGHLDELQPVLAAFDADQRTWVTQRGPRATELEASGERVIYLPDYVRDPRAAAALARVGFLTGLRSRADVLVTTGAGMAVPVALGVKARSGHVVFIETLARLTGRSRAGEALHRIADATVIQWPEQRALYPQGILCRPTLFDPVEARPTGSEVRAAAVGTVVTVGTHQAPMARLLDHVRDAVEAGVLPGPVVMQSGATGDYDAPGMTVRPFIPPVELTAMMARARYVVTHGGVGSMGSALRAGRRPLTMPRRHAHGEHFDDHQDDIVAKFERMGLAVRVDGAIEPRHLRAADAPLPPPDRRSAPTLAEVVSDRVARWRRTA